jgi:hypothetical protein
MKQLKISISCGKEYEDVYKFLKDKGNASRFVCELVRDHMSGDGLVAKIEKVVAKLLSGKVDVKEDDLKKAVNNFEF